MPRVLSGRWSRLQEPLVIGMLVDFCFISRQCKDGFCFCAFWIRIDAAWLHRLFDISRAFVGQVDTVGALSEVAMEEKMEENGSGGKRVEPLPLSSVNHLSRNCTDIKESLKFYVDILGFVPVKRPNSLDVKGAWLYNYGIGIHLLQREDVENNEHQNGSKKEEASEEVINPKDDHLSFQCEDVSVVQKRLHDAGIKYEKRIVRERGIEVDQIFFHDPDGFMIEICTCERLPMEPIAEPIV